MMGIRFNSRSFDYASRDKAARDFAQDDSSYIYQVVTE
jgi:hypothetical protein